MDKITTTEIECKLSNHFNYRQNIIVPNICWGMWLHECDLLVVRKSGHAIEIEIKVSKSDLKADLKKRHQHKDDRISELYFAIPDYIVDSIEFIPEHAGIIVLSRGQYDSSYLSLKILREPKTKGKYKFTDQERLKIAHLGSMRIWNLKRKLISKKEKKKKVIDDTIQIKLL